MPLRGARRAELLFGGLWLLAGVVGLLLAGQPSHPLADVTHYKLWARLVTVDGLTAAYAGEYPDSYAIYPPVTLYGLSVVGYLYRTLVDPTFEREAALASHWLTVAIRLLALGAHLVAGLVIFRLLRREAGSGAALLGGALYLLGPGALWDVAIWGQPDAWHSLFGLLALWSIGRGRPGWGGGWLALALATKPQAWVLVPLGGLALARQGPRAVLRAALAGGAVLLAVAAPFVLRGRLGELLTLPGHISSVMPVAAANAHNLWWLVTGAAFPFVLDAERLPGPVGLTYRQAALALVGLATVFVLWRAWTVRGPWGLIELGAFSAQAWFCLTAGAHENHPFMIVPLLAMVAWRSRFLLTVTLVIILTFGLNVLLHDFGLEDTVAGLLGPWDRRLQLAASLINLLLLVVWGAWLARSRRAPGAASEA